MGLLDSLIGALGQGSGGQPDLLSAVVGMLANDGPAGGLGGIAGLVERFQQGGLGEVVQSWISTGQNLPVSPDQLHDALGSDTIANLARQLGMSHGDLAGQLSQLLPQVVDQLTPNGQLPSGGLGNMADLLAGLMRR